LAEEEVIQYKKEKTGKKKDKRNAPEESHKKYYRNIR